MKKILKKIISLVIVCSLLMGISVTALAADTENVDEHPEVLTLKNDGHGQFSIVKGRSRSADTITVTATEDKEIYHVEGDKYVTEVMDNTYLMVDKVDVNTDDMSANIETFEQHQIPEYILESIAEEVAKQKALDNDEFAVSVFAPSFVDDGIMPLVDDPLIEQQDTVYYTSGNYRLRDIPVKYWHQSTVETSVNGTGVKDAAESFSSFAISIAGVLKSTVAAFTYAGLALSALSFFETLYGTVTYGSSSDKGTTIVVYDKIRKTTEVFVNGNWYPGCISQKVWLDKHGTQLYFAVPNKLLSKELGIGKVIYSDNFEEPAQKAIQFRYNTWSDSSISIKIWNRTHVL